MTGSPTGDNASAPLALDDAGMDAMTAIAREAFEKSVARLGKHVNWKPTLTLHRGDGFEVGIIGNHVAGMEVSAEIGLALQAVVTDDVQWVTITADTYATIDHATYDRVVAGEIRLADLYAHRHPHVFDCLMVHAMDRTGHQCAEQMAYRIRGRAVHWLTHGSTRRWDAWEGDVADAVRRVMVNGG